MNISSFTKQHMHEQFIEDAEKHFICFAEKCIDLISTRAFFQFLQELLTGGLLWLKSSNVTRADYRSENGSFTSGESLESWIQVFGMHMRGPILDVLEQHTTSAVEVEELLLYHKNQIKR